MKKALRLILPLFGFLLVTAVMYPDVWLGRRDLYANDLIDLNLPQRRIAARIWRSGEVPLWNRYAFGGQPLLAAGQAGVLYPPNALYLFLPVQTALNLSTMLHLALAGLLMSLYLRQLWRRATPAWIGGVITMTSGFFTGHVIHTQMLNAAAWIPLVLYFLERLRHEQRVRDALGLALTTALIILAGHPQMVYYTALLSLAYLAFVLAGEKGKRRPILLMAGAGLLLGGMLGAVQLWPTYALVQRSCRRLIGYAFFANPALPLGSLKALVVPFRNGGGATGCPGEDGAWELTGYAGIAALLLAATNICPPRRRDRHVLFFTGIGLAGLMIAAGDLTPVCAFLYGLPIAHQFRAPARFVLFFDLAVAVLAARALCRLMDRDVLPALPRLEPVPGIRRWSVTAILGGAFLLFIVMDAVWERNGLPPRVWLVPGLYVLATLILLCALRTRPGLLVASLGALILLDNSSYVREFTRSLTSPIAVSRCGQIRADGGWIRCMQADTERGRIASFDAALGANLAGQWGLEAINGYDALYPIRYARAVNLQVDSFRLAQPATWTPLRRSREAIDLLNVRYVVAPPAADLGDTPRASASVRIPVRSLEAVRAVHLRYQLLSREPTAQGTDGGMAPAPLARITLVAKDGAREAHPLAEEIPLEKARALERIEIDYTEWRGNLRIPRLQLMGVDSHVVATYGPLPTLGHPFQEIYRDARRAVFRNTAGFPRYWMARTSGDPRTRLTDASIRETAYRHREFRVRVVAPSRGWFVVGQLHDPGWAAYVDGQRRPVEEIGEQLMGIPLAAGTHALRFRYEPIEWTYGLRVSLLALLGMATWAGCARRRGACQAHSNTRPSGGPPGAMPLATTVGVDRASPAGIGTPGRYSGRG